MTKQELLTKLAIECATWGDARETAVGEVFLGNVEWDGASPNITKQDWLAERARLLNKPGWADAPEGATHLAADIDGEWFFYDGVPYRYSDEWSAPRCWAAGCSTAIPAGYDWKESLEGRPV